jgi:hypothetical protein
MIEQPLAGCSRQPQYEDARIQAVVQGKEDNPPAQQPSGLDVVEALDFDSVKKRGKVLRCQASGKSLMHSCVTAQ